MAITLGLAALLASSALAFGAVQYVGAAWLIYHGLRAFGAPVAGQARPVPAARPLPGLFIQGVLVNLLNPVTALFFGTVLPQFVDPASGAVTGQILFFACLYAALGLCNGSLYALLAGMLHRWLTGHAWYWRPLHCLIGSLYMALGCRRPSQACQDNIG